jgi:hypothetical protein
MKLFAAIAVVLLGSLNISSLVRAEAVGSLVCELSVPDNAEVEWENVALCEQALQQGTGTKDEQVRAALSLFAYYDLQAVLDSRDLEKSRKWLAFAQQNWPDNFEVRTVTASISASASR